MHAAIAEGHTAAVRDAVAERGAAEVLAADAVTGDTALHVAAAHGRTKLLVYLLTLPVSVNARNADGATAAHLAARNGHDGLVIYLLRRGADVRNLRDRDGLSVYDASSEDLCEILDEYQPKTLDIPFLVNAFKPARRIDDQGMPEPTRRVRHTQPGLVAGTLQRQCIEAAKRGDLGTLQRLLEIEGVSPLVHDAEGKNALHLACEHGQVHIVRYLLERGADPNKEEEYMNTPLLISSGKGHVEIIALLLEYGAQANCRGLFGHAPLLHAAEMGHLETVRLLVEQGQALVNISDSDGYTPLHYAALRKHDAVAQYLAAHGADVWIRNLDGKTPMHLASANLRAHLEQVSPIPDGTVLGDAAGDGPPQQSLSSALLGGKTHLEIDSSALLLDTVAGEGNLGVVFQSRWQGRDVAVKKLHGMWHSRRTLELLGNEIFVLSSLKHERIVALLGACTNDPDNLMVVTEFLPGGSLAARLAEAALDPQQMVLIALDVANALFYLHQRQYVHRDVRAANVLLDADGRAKLSDFALCAQVRDVDGSGARSDHIAAGSLRWMAPEAFSKQCHLPESDVYSFGLLMWELATGRMPFDDLAPTQAAHAALEDRRRPDIAEMPQPARFGELAQMCWAHDRNDRPATLDVLTALEAMSDGTAAAVQLIKKPRSAPKGEDAAKARPAPPSLVVTDAW